MINLLELHLRFFQLLFRLLVQLLQSVIDLIGILLNLFVSKWVLLLLTATHLDQVEQKNSVLKICQSNTPTVLVIFIKESLSFVKTTLDLVDFGLLILN